MWQQRVVTLGRCCRGCVVLQSVVPPIWALEAQASLASSALAQRHRRGRRSRSEGEAGAEPRPFWTPAVALAGAATIAAAAAQPSRCETAQTQPAAIVPASSGNSRSTVLHGHYQNVHGLSGHLLRTRTVTVFIGLPFRGKAHMARRLKRYLEFFHGFEVEIFDVNQYTGAGGTQKLLEALKEFFTSDGGGAVRRPDKHVNGGRFVILCATDTQNAQSSMWSGHSKYRRRWINQTLEKELQAHSIFVEIHVDDTSTHRREYIDRLERLRGFSPGSIEKMISEFEKDYVTIQSDGTEDDMRYMKLTNYNRKVVNNRMMRSFIGSRIAQFLTSVHPYKRTVYLSRHGESEYNVQKKLGGDSGLSPLGREYAPRLAEFAEYVICRGAEKFACITISSKENKAEQLEQGLTRIPRSGHTGGIFAKEPWGGGVQEGMQLVRMQRGYGLPFEDIPPTVKELVEMCNYQGPLVLVFVDDVAETQTPARLWTSSLRRTKETAAHIRHPIIEGAGGVKWTQMAHGIYRSIDEVYAGEFEGLTYEDIMKISPEDAKLRKLDKLGYRYPRGESYYDVIARLDLAMQQLETYQEPILVIGHQAIHRMVYAFLAGVKREEALELAIPLHTVIKLEFDGTGSMRETRYFLGPRRLDEDDGQKNF